MDAWMENNMRSHVTALRQHIVITLSSATETQLEPLNVRPNLIVQLLLFCKYKHHWRGLQEHVHLTFKVLTSVYFFLENG